MLYRCSKCGWETEKAEEAMDVDNTMIFSREVPALCQHCQEGMFEEVA